MNSIPTWYSSKIEKLREIGFFKSESNEAVAHRIIAESKNSYYGDILKLKDDSSFIQILSLYDKKKVWFVEDWMTLGSTNEFESNFYLEVLQCLARISNDFFTPENIQIEECGYCDGRDKRLNISFSLNQN